MARSGRGRRGGGGKEGSPRAGSSGRAGSRDGKGSAGARGGRRRRRGGSGRAQPQSQASTASSQPTGRAAYADTRAWLLRTHGHVCAYCGLEYPPRQLTLDHVTPRRGQSAYDRRDNLVLACKRCNAAKADKSFMAWVLGARSRAVNLYRYGQHLSEGILDMLRPFVGPDVALPPPTSAAQKPTPKKQRPRHKFGPDKRDSGSPYAEPSPYLD